MALTELMGQSVWDSQGIWVGHVVDVRVVRNKGGLQESHTVYGLVVSAIRGPVFFGLTRDREGRFGWVSEAVAKVVYTGCTFVPWEAVEDYGDGEVILKTVKKELSRV
ncbi:hypothetical protein [Nonomuraea endophytica]|uniref:Sporulation protein YlmC with PRC-barrel domain n=1 Tax=Nonomuraea endophytica TaxID=714136 RepID=A0A7W8EHW7_9ACTN|nr:hypothetical protein [Nonomuraea endophytica]MBB5079871.1 sporulation protein YlmC with PRC-barrel domain [Nonomuraea endophytica]